MSRNSLLAVVHIARKELGLDEDTYRDVLSRVSCGRASSGKDLTDRELELVIASFKARGWKPSTKAGPKARSARGKRSASAHVRKVWALWQAMCADGLVREPTRAGLRSFVVRMTKVADPEWLSAAQAVVVIEGLKAWSERARQEGA